MEADGALKNVVAIGAGMADGLGAEDNTRDWRVAAEGIRTSRVACQLAGQFGVDAPTRPAE